jgi:hypothetical protein
MQDFCQKINILKSLILIGYHIKLREEATLSRKISLNQFFCNILEKYNGLSEDLKQRDIGFFSKNGNYKFFNHWFSLHLDLLGRLSTESPENIDSTIEKFIHKRSRMMSGFVQVCKLNQVESLNVFKMMIFQHDKEFKSYLSEILNYLSAELIKVQRFRKVSAAYEHVSLND